MSIGSVPPNTHHNCVNNVTFSNVMFDTPFKAIYIKTNPGDEGTGSISNIHYKDMVIKNPVW